jgi:ectoine hydroxylase-related dioxygenase (phytanoyl-CoA dioxygenase family)
VTAQETIVPATLSREEVERFHDEGFLSVPHITSEEEVLRIRGLYDRLFDQRTGWDKGDFFDFAGNDEPGSAPTVPQLLNPSRYEESLLETEFRSNAHAMAKQLLGPTAELVFEHAMMKPAMTGGETPWHQDEAFYPKFTDYHSVTFWMPLQAVDLVNGCLDFIPGSNNGPLLPHRSINNDPRIHGLEAVGADGNKKVTCPLQVGGATVHHYRTLHHAGPNLSNGPRRAYALGFGVRSRDYTQRVDWPWNIEKATARGKRAHQAQTPMQRYVRKLKDAAKSVLR